MNSKSNQYTYNRLLFLLVLLFCHSALSQTTITMQQQGRDTVYLSPTNTYTILDPGGYNNYGQYCKDTLVLISSNNEPFVINGSFSINTSDYFAIFQGSNTKYPLENFYSGNGTINLYCYEGAITILFFSRRTVGNVGFEFSLCFPQVKNPHVERTNSHYTNICWNDVNSNSWQVSYTIANSGSTSYDTTYTTRDSLTTLGAGEKYHYQIIPLDYSSGCTIPLLSFRTPKVEDCNSCDHYRNCIDFASLTQNNSQVYCYKGTTDIPDETPCVVDDGNTSTSRHIVLDTSYTTDERTGHQLNIIPDNESNVVRLGNYSEGSQGESIMYELHIDTNDYDLMILRYAMVMKLLSSYSNQNPRISIRLTDENCRPVRPLCYCRDYIGDTNSNFWNTSSWSNSQYLWHDWQSMAIDVSDYHGKTLYLQLSTHDGKNTQGSAYMYFTLHCSRKQIDHLRQCGNNIENTFFAPEGFNYRWYNTANPGITLSTSDSLHVTDSGFYQCWVTPIECYDNSCGYTINALASPRYPKADFEYLDTTGRCTFTIKFINRSTINYSPDSDTPLWTREDCETAYWDFGNGQTSTEYNPEVVYDTAGVYRVTLISGIADDNCKDTISQYIVLNWQYGRPQIIGPRVLCPPSDTDIINLSVTNNSGTPTWFLDGEWYPQDDFPLFSSDLTHSNHVLCAVSDSNGCSDTLRHDITILPEYNNTIVQTICQAQLDPVWIWRGHEFYPGEYTRDHYFADTTRAGCDSNVTLRLIINETYNRYYEYVFCDYTTEFPYPPNSANPLIVYDTIGEHSYTFHTTLGCDSIIHLNIRKHLVDHDTIHYSICQGEAFDTLDFHYSATQNNLIGTRTETHSATEQSQESHQIQSCDSTMTLILTINPHSSNTRSYVRNENQLPLSFCGVDFYHSVTDTVFRLTNQYGCDSLVHLTFHINFNTQTHLYNAICDNELPFTWDGLIFDSAEVKPTTLHRTNGADSIVYRHLTVHPTFAITTHDTICDDGSITFCGNNYTLANTYVHHLQSIEGCDSNETLILTVNPTHDIAISETICSNQPYYFAGQNLTTTSVYSNHFENIYGCDSLVTLSLTVNQTSDTTISETIIENDLPHTFNSHIYNNDVNGDTIKLVNRHGCDSIIHYYLSINWNQSTFVDQTICFELLESTYNWDGTLFSVSDLTPANVPPITTVDIIKQVTLTNIQGADSIVTRRLHVNPTFNHHFADTICDNATYTFAGTTYNSTGTYTHYLSTIANCDSTVTLALTVYAVTHSIFDTTILENELSIFNFNGHTFTGEVSHYTITIPNNAGCDSVIDFSLHIIPNVSTHVDSTVCASLLPLMWNGKSFSTAGTQNALLYTVNGADSTVSMTLHVNPIYDDTTHLTICDNESTTFNGTAYNLSGIHTDTLMSIDGCDSVTTLVLIVNPTHVSDFHDTTCNNQTYSFGGVVRDTEGDHVHVFQNSYLCDSTVTLHLHIDSVTHSHIDEVLVQNDLPHTFNGVTYSLAQMEAYRDSHPETTYSDTITILNRANCDSIIYHTLTINWNQSTTVCMTICDNQFPVDWDNTLFTASEYTWGDTVIIKQVTLSNIDGADSIVTRRLHINPTYATSFRDTICDDATYNYNGNSYVTTGDYPNMLQTIDNCDSLVTLQLTVNAVTYSDLYDTIVENQMPYTLNGTTYLLSETELIAPLMRYLRDTVIITNVKGCDSIIDLRLYVHMNVYDTVDSTICDNFLPLQWNARTFSNYVFGIWNYELNDTLSAWTGADSILTMRLHVKPTYDLHFYDTICSNEQVIFNGTTYTTPGVYAHPLTSSLQCDSLETLHLTVFGTSAANISDTIVENTLRQTYTFNGVLFDTLLYGPDQQITSRFSQLDSTIIITNQIGCDSTIHYSLCVHWNVAATADSTICENYLPLSWNARTFNHNDIAQEGYNIAKLDTLVAHTGADSILTMWLHVDTNSSSTIPDTVLENLLPHTFNGVTYTLAQMEAIREGNNSQNDNEANITYHQDTIVISNHKGCDSVIYHALYIRWNRTTDIVDTICENFFPYSWQGRTVAADSTLLSVYNVPFTMVDTVIYTAAGGEDSLVVMHLHVKRNSISTLYDTIVENQMNHNWNGVTFTWDDTLSVDIRHADLQHTGIITNTTGCDSIAEMNLMVWLNRTAVADSTVCENYFDFTWNGVVFDTSDSKNVLLATTEGADSLLTMNVTELFNSTSTITDTIVENQLAYNFNGALFDHSHFGDTTMLHIPPSRITYIDTSVLIANSIGCDSIISYRLNVWWNVRNGIDDTLCSQVLPHQWNSRTFTQAVADTAPTEGRWKVATLYDTLVAWSGADSILAMRLHVMPSFYINFNDTVCSSSYVAWYGDTLYETGVYPMAFNTVDGCDSIEYLHFANYPNYDFEYYDTICDYSGMMRLGVEYMGVAHLPTINGCDSNEVYHLWGMPVSYSNVDTIVSEHQIPFAYNNEWFSDSGTTQQQFILINQYGCDSIVNFTITVMPTVRQTLDSSICDVMMPLDWDGTVFSYETGVMNYEIIDTLPGTYGADSIVTRRVHVSPSYNLVYYDTTCNGAPYHFGDSIYTETGLYTHNYLTTITDPVFGVRCDSIETLHLQVNAMSYATVHDTIVENQLPYTFGGITFTTTAEIIDSTITILNTVACDSVITYSLHIFPNSYIDKDTTLCDNQLPFSWDGRIISHGGLDSVVVLMPNGTDSVTRYWTVVHPTYNITDTVRTCDIYEWIDGNTYTESSVVNGFTLTSTNGCDSVKNLKLTIDHQVTTHDSISSCDPYTWIDSITYSTSVSGPTYMLKTTHGCDSTVILEFTKYTPKVTELYDTICRGVRYSFGGNEYVETGLYSDSLQTEENCDSVVLLNLHVLEPPSVSITWEYDCDTRIYTITGHCDVPYFEWNSFPEDPGLTGHTHDRTIQVRPTTHETYFFFADYKDVPTCPADTSVNLSPLLRPHALIEYTPEFLTYDQLHMSAISRCTNEETRRWFVNDNDMGDHERISYLADPRTDDSVVVMLTAHHGICHDTDLVVIPFRKAAIWAPNAFTPGESSNNMFFVRYIGITDYRIDLYTRGGVLVWHSEDMNEGWDGTYKGKPCPQETYVWIIHYRDVTAPKNLLSKKGTVTLIR